MTKYYPASPNGKGLNHINCIPCIVNYFILIIQVLHESLYGDKLIVGGTPNNQVVSQDQDINTPNAVYFSLPR